MKAKSDAPAWRYPIGIGIAFAVAMTLTGCPYGSDLDNLEAHYEGTGEGCDLAKQLLEARCGGSICHTGPDPYGSIDLVTEGFEANLLTATATYNNAYPADGCPMPPAVIVDTEDIDNSWLLKKIRGEQGDCGGRMPDSFGLDQEEEDCIVRWLEQLAREGAP